MTNDSKSYTTGIVNYNRNLAYKRVERKLCIAVYIIDQV